MIVIVHVFLPVQNIIFQIYNQFYNNLRLFDALPNFPFTKSATMCDYYL